MIYTPINRIFVKFPVCSRLRRRLGRRISWSKTRSSSRCLYRASLSCCSSCSLLCSPCLLWLLIRICSSSHLRLPCFPIGLFCLLWIRCSSCRNLLLNTCYDICLLINLNVNHTWKLFCNINYLLIFVNIQEDRKTTLCQLLNGKLTRIKLSTINYFFNGKSVLVISYLKQTFSILFYYLFFYFIT